MPRCKRRAQQRFSCNVVEGGVPAELPDVCLPLKGNRLAIAQSVPVPRQAHVSAPPRVSPAIGDERAWATSQAGSPLVRTEHRVLAAFLQALEARRAAPRSRVGAPAGRNQRSTSTSARGCYAARPGVSRHIRFRGRHRQSGCLRRRPLEAGAGAGGWRTRSTRSPARRWCSSSAAAASIGRSPPPSGPTAHSSSRAPPALPASADRRDRDRERPAGSSTRTQPSQASSSSPATERRDRLGSGRSASSVRDAARTCSCRSIACAEPRATRS